LLLPGASENADGGTSRGAAFVIFLARSGGVQSFVKMSSSSTLLSGKLHDGDRFGKSVELMSDINQDTYMELAVGAHCE
jgi:hypothetical protein